MYAYVMVRSTICDTCTICKIQEHANITNIQCVAQIELSQIVRSICQIERTVCDTDLLFAKHGHTNVVIMLSKLLDNFQILADFI